MDIDRRWSRAAWLKPVIGSQSGSTVDHDDPWDSPKVPRAVSVEWSGTVMSSLHYISLIFDRNRLKFELTPEKDTRDISAVRLTAQIMIQQIFGKKKNFYFEMII